MMSQVLPNKPAVTEVCWLGPAHQVGLPGSSIMHRFSCVRSEAEDEDDGRAMTERIELPLPGLPACTAAQKRP